MLNKFASLYTSVFVFTLLSCVSPAILLAQEEVRPASQGGNIAISCMTVGGGRIVSGQELYDYHKDGQYHEIKLVLSVQDENGRTIGDLKKSSFTVLVDGEPIEGEIKFQRMNLESTGARFAIVLDASLSMYGRPLAETKAIAKSFLSAIAPADRACVIMASAKTKRLCDLKSEDLASTFIDAISVDRSEVGSAYYDALSEAVNILQRQAGRKAILAFWDGEDNESAMNIAGLIATAKERQLPIFVVENGQRDTSSAAISKLASETGGLHFKASRDFAKIDDYGRKIYGDISDKMRDCYGVAVQTRAISADGRTHSLQVKAADAEGRVGQSPTYTFIADVDKAAVWQTIPKLMIPLLCVLIALVALFIFAQRVRSRQPTASTAAPSVKRGTEPLDASKLAAVGEQAACPVCQRPMSPSEKKCECGWEKRPPISLTGD